MFLTAGGEARADRFESEKKQNSNVAERRTYLFFMVAGASPDPSIRIDWEVVETPPNRAALWRRAVDYLLRLAKVKRHWAAGGTALKFLADRRKFLNDQIEAEIKEKAEIAAKSKKKNGVKPGVDEPASDPRARGLAARR